MAGTLSDAPTFLRQSDIKKPGSVIMLSFFLEVHHLVNKFDEQFPYQK